MIEVAGLASVLRKFGTFELIQAPLCAVAVAVAFMGPNIGTAIFGEIERGLRRIAVRPYFSLLFIAGLAIACRAILMPWMHVVPTIPDEISLRLQAETYLNGHLSDPGGQTDDYGSIYTLLKPTYASMYPALRSLPLVVGKLLGLDFWVGAWMFVVLLCVATYWALRAYVSSPYALVAALIVVVRLGIFSIWVNSYFGASLTAIGGLLLIGGYGRLIRRPTIANGFAVGAGVFLMMMTRPFEGLMFSIPVAMALAALFLKTPEKRGPLVVAGTVAAGLVLCGLAFTAVHDQAVTGDWRKAPYMLYREASGGPPPLLFQQPTPAKIALYEPQRVGAELELSDYQQERSFHGLLSAEISRFEQYWNFYVGIALTLPFLLGLYALRRHPVLLVSLASLGVGLAVETFDWPQYASPAFAVIMIAIAIGLKLLRRWDPNGRPVGLALSRLLPLGLIVGLALPLTSLLSSNPKLKLRQIGGSSCCWIPRDSVHAAVERSLSRYDGRKLVVVDTGPRARKLEFIVFNDADLDHAQNVWINEDARLNRGTFLANPSRRLWHVGWTSAGAPCLQAGPYGFGPATATSDLKLRDDNDGPFDVKTPPECIRLSVR